MTTAAMWVYPYGYGPCDFPTDRQIAEADRANAAWQAEQALKINPPDWSKLPDWPAWSTLMKDQPP